MHAQKPQPQLAPHDWNFDSVPNHHLIACCYWEYARESAFLRDFKSRCVEANRNPKPLAEVFELVGKDARRVLSIGTVANSFLLGFGFEPDQADSAVRTPHYPITGLFPAPWQSLSRPEKDYRAHLAAGAVVPDAPPFQRAAGADAVNALFFLAHSIASSIPPLPAHLYRQTLQNQLDLLNSYADPKISALDSSNVRRTVPLNGPSDTRHSSTNPSIHQSANPLLHPSPAPLPALLRLDTHSQFADEIALVHIQWGSFTDDQIVDSFRA